MQASGETVRIGDESDVAAALLAWYDLNARRLPWRALPGEPAPDPYRVWLSEVMLQQTTVAAVRAYYARFLDLWPKVEALAAAEDADVMAAWAGLGYYARARNLLACAREVARRGGFPRTEAGLRELPGLGAYTAAAVAAIAFGERAVVVDVDLEVALQGLPRPRQQLRGFDCFRGAHEEAAWSTAPPKRFGSGTIRLASVP